MQYTSGVLRLAGTETDGRLARSARARTAVVDALLDLVQEGDLRPTAPRIAERAGVSLRLVFHHFRDLERLFAVAAERQFARVRLLARPIPPTGPLARRVDAFVRQRVRLLERITPVRRAALLMEPHSPALAARLAEARGVARAQVERVFAAELTARPAAAHRDLAAALGAVSSWSTWQALRAHQRLSCPRAARVLTRMLTALLQEER
jgi:TetR/AcrR family transcriptional regulator of autoinduction and epiphytic fitness